MVRRCLPIWSLGLTLSFWFALSLALGVRPAFSAEIAPGVTYTLYSLPGPNRIYVMAIDRLRSEYKLKVGWSQKKRNYTAREGTSAIASRYDSPPGHDVLAAINGSYFDGANLPRLIGIGQTDGQMLDTPAFNPSYTYHTFMMGPTRLPVIRTNFNHVVGTLTFADGYQMALNQHNFYMNGPLYPVNAVTAFTPSFDARTGSSFIDPDTAVELVISNVSYPMRSDKEVSGIITAVRTGAAASNNAIPAGGMVLSSWGITRDEIVAHARTGARIRMLFSSGDPEYNNSDNAITGIGWITHGGAAYPAGWNNLESGAAPYSRNPRTVLAWNDKTLFQVVCDGRSANSVGMTFQEMSDFLTVQLKATEAMNLDGGGSSTMVVNGSIVNTPSDGSERAVANAVLLVKQDTKTVFPFSDAFARTGRLAGWDDKFFYNEVAAFSPTSPGGDGYVMNVSSRTGGVNTVRRGDFGDTNYSVEADVYCEYRPEVAADGFERGGVFARDSGAGALGYSSYGGGNCYAMLYDSDTGAVRAGKYVNGQFADFLVPGTVTVTSSGWHRFRIDCYGTTIRYFLDGAKIAWAPDGSFARGYFGIGYHEFYQTAANMNGTRADNFRAFVDPAGFGYRGDSDDDNDVDQDDFGVFQRCLGTQNDAACASARLDEDGDVDKFDLDIFRGCFRGADNTPPDNCKSS